MSATLITFIIIACVLAVVVINRIFIKEEDLIKKAEKNSMVEYLSKTSEYDRHPIGSYFKMRNELNGILKTAGNFHGYKLSLNLGEVGTGVAVMLVFVGVVTLGVVLC